MSRDRDIFKPTGGSIYRQFNEMRERSREALYQALLKMIPHPGQNWKRNPSSITRSMLMYYLSRNNANMKIIKSAYHGLEVYAVICRIKYRWQFDNNDEFMCQNPLYPSKGLKIIKINDMCPRLKKRVQAGVVRPPSDYEKLIRQKW